jgi:tRNA G37 N-methylase TrmD
MFMYMLSRIHGNRTDSMCTHTTRSISNKLTDAPLYVRAHAYRNHQFFTGNYQQIKENKELENAIRTLIRAQQGLSCTLQKSVTVIMDSNLLRNT